MKVYLPWLGEFGNELLRWVPMVKTDRGEKVICHEAGKECLYPDATVRHVVPRIAETDRKCAGAVSQMQIWNEIRAEYGDAEYIVPSSLYPLRSEYERFAPETKDFGFECDVAVFPRWRHNTTRKNWEAWPGFIGMLLAEGLNVFACGHPDSSFPVACWAAWDFENPLEASIWAIKHSKLRIGLTTALTVMSLYCGMKPWIIITEKGTVSHIGNEGPNTKYFDYADINDVGWRVLPLYHDPRQIVAEVKRAL